MPSANLADDPSLARRTVVISGITVMTGCLGTGNDPDDPQSEPEDDPQSEPENDSQSEPENDSQSEPDDDLSEQEIISLITPPIKNYLRKDGGMSQIWQEWREIETDEDNGGLNVSISYLGKKQSGVPFFASPEEATQAFMDDFAFGTFEGLFTSEYPVKNVSVTSFLKIEEDKYGNPQYEEVYLAGLDRETAEKIQWDNLEADQEVRERLPRLASPYEFTWPFD